MPRTILEGIFDELHYFEQIEIRGLYFGYSRAQLVIIFVIDFLQNIEIVSRFALLIAVERTVLDQLTVHFKVELV